MAELSKLARRALAKQAVAGAHPDAGLLTAFAERALIAREREQVLAHLATCAECREVVALAAPEQPPAEEATVAPRQAGWLTVPLMRWGAVAAAVAVVAVAVVMQAPKVGKYSAEGPRPASGEFAAKAKQEQPAAQLKPPASTPVAAAAEKDQPARDGEAAEVSRKNAQAATPARAREDQDQKRAQGAQLAEARPAAPTAAPAQAADEVAYGRAVSAPSPAASSTGAPAGGKAEANAYKIATKKDDAANQEAKLADAQKPAAEASTETASVVSQTAAGSGTMARAKGAYGPGFAGGLEKEQAANVAVSGTRAANPRFELDSGNARWIVTSDGRVQRSTDGRTWVYVPIASDVQFRALAANGNDVWAGGTKTALFHSIDGGKSWKKMALTALTGDIVRLLADRRSLIITTSSGQRMEVSYDSFGEGDTRAPIQH
ncbi:MAG TPA: zf-HC2 domain-containing protein [Terriglobales bacterium]|nr:zf-HC2 domain-containing protein [Terriglobales bacterium]